MPWHIEHDNPACSGYAVVKDSDGKVEGCHDTKDDAMKQMAALYANEPRSTTMTEPFRPPRDNLVRAIYPGVTLRSLEVDDGRKRMEGHFAVFDQWTEIDSMWEGHFMERVAPGAFRKTFKENRDNIRVLFQHGQDFQVGDKPLGPIEELAEDDTGAFYRVALLDTSYNRDITPGLEEGLYGASFRFRVWKEDREDRPEASAYNPGALPERTIREAELFEFGPVTFPAYSGATAGVRSLTDSYVLHRFGNDPSRLREVIAEMREPDDTALSGDGAGTDHSDVESRLAITTPPGKPPDPPGTPKPPRRFYSREEFLEWIRGT